MVYAKRPFAGPKQVLAYLARYTHRVAIANSRLVKIDRRSSQLPLEGLPGERPHKSKTMRLPAGEFIRRFLLHVLPDGFHRIRHYGLFANGHRAEKLAHVSRAARCAPSAATERAGQAEEAIPARRMTSRRRVHAAAVA